MIHMFASLITVRFGDASKTEGRIVSATVSTIYHGDDKPQKFRDTLKHIVFAVKLKPCIQRDDCSAKGDWEVGITINAMEAAKTLIR